MNRNLNKLPHRKGYNVISKEQIAGDFNVVDINIDTKEHTFITSHGIVSHNCALGGEGNPNKHEHFEEILKASRRNGIVPNYTTSGFELTDYEVSLTKEYCGAVAVSYFHPSTDEALYKFIDTGCKTNIHFVLNNNNISKAIELLQHATEWYPKLNAIIFLTYKPVGKGVSEKILKPDSPRFQEFIEMIDNWKSCPKIGFDSCFMAIIVNRMHNINKVLTEPCEATRFSMYITPDMIALPCSFDHSREYGFQLDYSKGDNIEKAWNSPQFNRYRNMLKNSCNKCFDRAECFGGCHLLPSITLCNRKERK